MVCSWRKDNCNWWRTVGPSCLGVAGVLLIAQLFIYRSHYYLLNRKFLVKDKNNWRTKWWSRKDTRKIAGKGKVPTVFCGCIKRIVFELTTTKTWNPEVKKMLPNKWTTTMLRQQHPFQFLIRSIFTSFFSGLSFKFDKKV